MLEPQGRKLTSSLAIAALIHHALIPSVLLRFILREREGHGRVNKRWVLRDRTLVHELKEVLVEVVVA